MDAALAGALGIGRRRAASASPANGATGCVTAQTYMLSDDWQRSIPVQTSFNMFSSQLLVFVVREYTSAGAGSYLAKFEDIQLEETAYTTHVVHCLLQRSTSLTACLISIVAKKVAMWQCLAGTWSSGCMGLKATLRS